MIRFGTRSDYRTRQIYANLMIHFLHIHIYIYVYIYISFLIIHIFTLLESCCTSMYNCKILQVDHFDPELQLGTGSSRFAFRKPWAAKPSTSNPNAVAWWCSMSSGKGAPICLRTRGIIINIYQWYTSDILITVIEQFVGLYMHTCAQPMLGGCHFVRLVYHRAR